MAALVALVLFVLAAFGVNKFGSVSVVDLGLAFVALALLIGNWPFGVIVRNRG